MFAHGRGVRVVSVPCARAEDLQRELHVLGVIDQTVRMTKRDGRVFIPLKAEPPSNLRAFGANVVEVPNLPARAAPRNPVEELRLRLGALGVPWELAPKKWERIGDVVMIRISEAGRPFEHEIARAFAEALKVETVVEDASGIHGMLRTPDVRLLLGSNAETIHVEGGVRYKLDLSRVMFSSGNLAERRSTVKLVRPGDVVVDLFAGIGYFTLPIAVHARAAEIHACELNPVAFQYLLENVRLNRVSNVVPHLGDCRQTAPRHVADLVLMGHFSARDYLDVAFETLRGTGTVVYHEICPREEHPNEPLRRFTTAAQAHWYDVESAHSRIVKSFAPGIVHTVLDAKVQRRPKGLSGNSPSGGR